MYLFDDCHILSRNPQSRAEQPFTPGWFRILENAVARLIYDQVVSTFLALLPLEETPKSAYASGKLWISGYPQRKPGTFPMFVSIFPIAVSDGWRIENTCLNALGSKTM